MRNPRSVMSLIEGLSQQLIRLKERVDIIEPRESGEFSGGRTYWDDLRVPMTTTRAAAKIPGFLKFKDDGAGSEGVFAWHFDKTTEEQLFFSVQMPHTWKAGSIIYPHVHWSPIDTDTGSAVWGLEYTWQSIGGVFGDTTIIPVEDPADGLAYKHQCAGFPTIDGTGQTRSSIMVCRIFRDAGSVLRTDDYDNDAVLHEFDIHYEIDSLGETVVPPACL